MKALTKIYDKEKKQKLLIKSIYKNQFTLPKTYVPLLQNLQFKDNFKVFFFFLSKIEIF